MGGVNKRLDGWMRVWIDGWVDEQRDKRVGESLHEWVTHDILIRSHKSAHGLGDERSRPVTRFPPAVHFLLHQPL